jgi:DNA-binding transcriptional LysR family regulator
MNVMPGLYVRRELQNDSSLRVMQLHGRAVYRTIGVAWRKSSARHTSFEMLTDLFRRALLAGAGDLATLESARTT